MKKLSIYTYGIMGFSECYNKETKQIENDLLIMFYGNNKKFVFPAQKAYDLICAIAGDKNPNGSKFDMECYNFELKYMSILQLLESRLKGRGFAMLTTFNNLVEYDNCIQNQVVGGTGYDLNGKLLAKNTKEKSDCRVLKNRPQSVKVTPEEPSPKCQSDT